MNEFWFWEKNVCRYVGAQQTNFLYGWFWLGQKLEVGVGAQHTNILDG